MHLSKGKVESCKFKDLDPSLKKFVLNNNPGGTISKSTRIIIVEDDDAIPTLHYDKPESAFIYSTVPITIRARDREFQVKGDSASYIQQDPRRIYNLGWRRGVWVAIASSVLILFALHCLTSNMVFRSDETATIQEEEYKSIHDLPQEYLELVPGILDNNLYASNGKDEHHIEGHKLNLLLNRLGNKKIYDIKLVPFYRSIIEDKQYGNQVKRMALLNLMYMVSALNRDDLIEPYYNHNEEFIRIEALRYKQERLNN